MKIAIIGAGLSGLSVAWHLSLHRQCAITLFDPQGIAGGASGIAAGLMHPYPGLMGMRSFMASEGIATTKHLLISLILLISRVGLQIFEFANRRK